MGTFYDRMKDTRKDADKTQKDIANMLQITHQQYQLYESGKRMIPIDLFTKFCEYFNVSSDYILGLEKGLEWPREEKRKYTDNCTKCTFLHRNFWETKNRPYGLFFIVTATFYGDLPKNVIETRFSYR